jgi:hypothetical protein
MILDNDLMDLWLLAGPVGLDTETARKLIEELQDMRDLEGSYECLTCAEDKQ